MRRNLFWLIIALLWSVFPAAVRAQDAGEKKLVGTWKMVSGTYGGQQSNLAKDFTTLKHYTPTHFMWVTFDKAGKVIRTGGGPYSFDGKVLEETPAYGLGSDFDVVNAKRQIFEVKVDGKKLYQSGKLSNGTSLEEAWELVSDK
jgi:hypothetical protein